MGDSSRVDEGNLWKVLKSLIICNVNKQDICLRRIPELSFHYHEDPEMPLRHFMRPILIVVAQGAKFVRIGQDDLVYPEGCFFVSAVDMPVASCVLTASKDKPYLSISIELNMDIMAAFVATSRMNIVKDPNPVRGAIGHKMDHDLLDAVIRLIEISQSDEDAAALRKNVLSEIHYRLLKSKAGEVVSTLCSMNLPVIQIRKIIDWIKRNYSNSFTIGDIAENFKIAPSTIHKHFKAVTSLSPIQYQKMLRLSEARRLLGKGNISVSEVATKVGYESATQFSREYKRLYGISPLDSRTKTMRQAP